MPEVVLHGPLIKAVPLKHPTSQVKDRAPANVPNSGVYVWRLTDNESNELSSICSLHLTFERAEACNS